MGNQNDCVYNLIRRLYNSIVFIYFYNIEYIYIFSKQLISSR